MAFHSLSKPQVAATVDSTAAQGHSHYWREGKDVKQAEGKIYIYFRLHRNFEKYFMEKCFSFRKRNES